MRPGTSKVEIECIAVFFCRKLGGRIPGDPAAELGVSAMVLAVCVGVLVSGRLSRVNECSLTIL